MKQVTVLCSSDLSDVVARALIGIGVEGWLHVPDATAVRPKAAAEHGRIPRYPAEMFVVPAEDAQARAVVEALREYTDNCETEPCLRVLVVPMEDPGGVPVSGRRARPDGAG